MAEAAADYLNAADLPTLPVAAQADALKTWSRLQSKLAAAEASLVSAFCACDGPAADGQKTMAAWLARFTRCTKPAAKGMVAASYRLRGHTHIAHALADGAITVSYGRWISDAVSRFDPVDRDTVEQILVDAAVGGALIADLEHLAAAASRRLNPGGLGRDEDRAHADRGLTLGKTFGGAGRMNADLDTEATALAEQVIGALSTKAGPEDDRTARQRRHDALAEAFRRLIGSDLLPERGGSKPHIKADIDLATLRSLPGSKQAEEEWLDRRMAALARARLHGATTQDLLTAPPQPPDLTNPDATDQPAHPLASPAPPTSTTPNPPPHDSAPHDSAPHDSAPHDSAPHDSAPSDSAPCGSPPCGTTPCGTTPNGTAPHDSVPYGSAAYGGGAARSGHSGQYGTTAPSARATTLPAGSDDLPRQPALPGLDEGAVLAGVGPISRALAAALACYSTITPTVTGTVDTNALEAMTSEWLHTHHPCSHTADGPPGGRPEAASTAASHTGGCGVRQGLCRHTADGPPGGGPDGTSTAASHTGGCGVRQGLCRHTADGPRDDTAEGTPAADDCGCGVRHGLTAETYLRLQHTMLRWAIRVLSGPGGLASYLRTRVLDGPLATPSIVLDVGTDDKTVPTPLERAVRRRDKCCRFPGCDHPAELSQVHHITPRSQGGATELWNLVTACSFHHLIAVHTWGWQLRLNPNGSTIAIGPDGRVLHENDPPGDPPLQAA